MTNTGTFTEQYATAQRELHRAQVEATPLDAAMAARMQATNPQRFAVLEALIAEAAAKLPALQARVQELEARACWKCRGTGEYDGASRYHRRGTKWCFTCHGTGERAAR